MAKNEQENETQENEEESEENEPTPEEKVAALEAEAKKWRTLSRKHEREAKANADAAAKLAEVEAQNLPDAEKVTKELEDLRAENAKLRLDAVRSKVAAEKGLSQAQARRLVGETEEELLEDADDLLESFKGATSTQESEESGDKESRRPPKERLRSGATSEPPSQSKDLASLGAEIYEDSSITSS